MNKLQKRELVRTRRVKQQMLKKFNKLAVPVETSDELHKIAAQFKTHEIEWLINNHADCKPKKHHIVNPQFVEALKFEYQERKLLLENKGGL